MKSLIAICGLILLASCAQIDPQQSVLVSQASDVADHVINDAEIALCRLPTVGAWVRKYGNDPEKAAAWKTLCSSQIKATP